jgi:hypothetical protein
VNARLPAAPSSIGAGKLHSQSTWKNRFEGKPLQRQRPIPGNGKSQVVTPTTAHHRGDIWRKLTEDAQFFSLTAKPGSSITWFTLASAVATIWQVVAKYRSG